MNLLSVLLIVFIAIVGIITFVIVSNKHGFGVSHLEVKLSLKGFYLQIKTHKKSTPSRKD